MNDNPGRESKQPELEPDDNELDDDDMLLHAELDPVEDDTPEFVADDDEDDVVEAPEELEELPEVPEVVAAVVEVEQDLEEPSEAVDAGVEDNAPPASPFRRAPRSLPAFEAAAGRSTQVPVFTVFRPESGSGSLIGVVAVVFCLAAGLALIYKSFGHDPSLTQFFPLVIGPVLLCLGALFAYWTWGSLSLRYVVDRNALTIRWGSQRQIVPLVNIERLIPAAADGEEPDIQGVDWPGHHVGKARVPQLGEVLFYSGHRSLSDVLYVQTTTETYGISVPDPVSFAEAVQSNQMRGPLFEQRQAVHRDGIAAQSFWIDPQARFLTLVLLGAFVLVLAYVLQTYPGLAQSVPLRFPAIGGLLRVTDKSELLDIPRSAAAFLGLNLLLAVVLHPWERMVSIVLLLAGIAIQLALLVAAIVAVA